MCVGGQWRHHVACLRGAPRRATGGTPADDSICTLHDNSKNLLAVVAGAEARALRSRIYQTARTGYVFLSQLSLHVALWERRAAAAEAS